MHGFRSLLFSVFAVFAAGAPGVQIPLHDASIANAGQVDAASKPRPLVGRFLQITDFHPDRFYQVYSSTAKDSACHRGQGPAGIYGAEITDCDSPIDLVNKTFEWLGENFKDDVDFVVWTGDSARHDNDDEIPRSAEQVIELNEFMVHKMAEVFGKHNGDEEDGDPNNDYVVPIIPTFGNNDILPHNVMDKGPNSWTRTYAKVWRQFIPEAQKHQFEQGGWFYVEAIPNKLAVFSLNTLYFFVSNAAVDGCALRSEPGYQQMEWLRIQLQFMRERGMKAILTGHVPPVRQDAKTSWDETCWQKYALWMQQYRDVVITSLYGHFNYDHFMMQDFNNIDKDAKHGRMQYFHADREAAEDEFHSAVSSNYFIQLRDEWSELPNSPKSMDWPRDDVSDEAKSKKEKERQKKFLRKIGGKFAERFSSTFVAASVVPNLYPAFRVFHYNITGLENHHDTTGDILPPMFVNLPTLDDDLDADKKKKKKKQYKFKVPEPPSKSSPPGPAYSPQTLTLLKYTQYLANLTHINNDFPVSSDSNEDEIDTSKWNEGKHKGKKPHDRDHTPHPRKFKFELHYDSRDDEVYQLKDLTMPNLVELARRIGSFVADDEDVIVLGEEEKEPDGKKEASTATGVVAFDKEKSKKHGKKKKHHKDGKHRKQNEAWYTFVQRAYLETMDLEELEEEFGR